MASTSRDRFKELAQAQKDENLNVDIEQNGDVPPEFKEVFQKVYEIRSWISTIEENTKRLKELMQTKYMLEKSSYDEIERIIKNTSHLSFKIATELKGLDDQNSKASDKNDKSVLSRIKRIQYASLSQKFQNAIYANSEFLESHREQKRALLKRQAALVNATLKDEELEKLLDNPTSNQLFTDNILLDTRIAKEEFAQIEQRHAELLKIENMLMEVNMQFKKMAILIEQQKEHIDRIEFHACDAINYVDKGLREIEEAEINKRKAKKKVFILIFCLILLALVLLLIFI